MRSSISLAVAALATAVFATPSTENRTIDEIYQAALNEGGVVTLWHGGDEKNQQDGLKQAFEKRFPGITLNVTVDLSKYHDGRLDEQLANNDVQVDSIILQTLHDYPRWKEEGALLNYKPQNFESIASEFQDPDGAYYGYAIFGWTTTWNTAKYNGSLGDFADALLPELKDKLILTYPNDDDAVLYAFDLVIKKLGNEWFDALVAQNPTWVRGSATPGDQLALANNSYVAAFGTGGFSGPNVNTSLPTDAPFVTWPQTAAILKDAPHPEGAKLLHNFILSDEWQFATPQWTVRTDAPANFPDIFQEPNTNVTDFLPWMLDRPNVERLRFWYEARLGTAQGLSPLEDDL
ncbi:periplasmic binding protein-like II [Aaosphaeria arxii CBS 175.79]|uniref:Periplasmic binding protein-like II n=1 Tax=Aaosphaeria arxii CBS 175.79 TaxID=1450172 RepID=A0A6A5X755_9PLEO|nr:periplasmic binding protein-like II [Aaosphaeria arxii CBS 175.79]KAF2008750.1 periplasmic binding protein-like II [Aaosphaeria arxii CBS 175.79]